MRSVVPDSEISVLISGERHITGRGRRFFLIDEASSSVERKQKEKMKKKKETKKRKKKNGECARERDREKEREREKKNETNVEAFEDRAKGNGQNGWHRYIQNGTV